MKLRSLLAGILALLIPMSMPGLSWAYQIGSLESGVQTSSGISRTIDAALQQRATARSIQVQTNFAHCCLAWGEAEIIAYNKGALDSVSWAVNQWVGSPDHWVVMSDPAYDRIGCGASYSSSGGFYAVCLFIDSEQWMRTPPIVNEIPNTSMSP